MMKKQNVSALQDLIGKVKNVYVMMVWFGTAIIHLVSVLQDRIGMVNVDVMMVWSGITIIQLVLMIVLISIAACTGG